MEGTSYVARISAISHLFRKSIYRSWYKMYRQFKNNKTQERKLEWISQKKMDVNYFSCPFVHKNPYGFAEPRYTCKILNTSQISFRFLVAPECCCSNWTIIPSKNMPNHLPANAVVLLVGKRPLYDPDPVHILLWWWFSNGTMLFGEQFSIHISGALKSDLPLPGGLCL